MRDILFRGNRIDNGEWVEGDICHHDGVVSYIGQHPADGSMVCFDLDSTTVGQYTGLTANGKKIFEWDVLQFNYTGKNHGVEGKATVIFEHGKFGVLWGWHKEFVCLDGFANTTIEVIGNIHDNPELLENP